MKPFLICCMVIIVTLLGGCDTTKHLPREIIIVPDTSASIDPDAQQQMFAAIEDVAFQLHRGDTLTVIPVTGNAEAELQGRTLHYAVPSEEDRQAYDTDLRTLKMQIKVDLARLQADAVAHPGKHTDILGSIGVALRAFSARPTDKRLIVLTDFIQDDRRLNFGKDPRLTNERDAKALGLCIGSPAGDQPFVNIVLGRLRSKEFSALPPSRQRAINAFWGQVMAPATVDPDGTAATLRIPPNQRP